MNILKDKGIMVAIALGVILVGIITFIVVSSSKTVTAWVPAENLRAGTVITNDNIYPLAVPVGTPGNFLKNKNHALGYKLKNNVGKDQLLYPSDFLASWESYNQNIDIPEDFIITSIQVPDSQAVGGLIVAGDTIDVMAVSKDNNPAAYIFEEVNPNLDSRRSNSDVKTYYILSNVKVINTNSSLSEAQDTDFSSIVGGSTGNRGGSYYIIALSYENHKKLRMAEKIFPNEIWLNLSPRQNEDNPPLINQMIDQSFTGLHDAQKLVQDKDGNPIIKDDFKDADLDNEFENEDMLDNENIESEDIE